MKLVLQHIRNRFKMLISIFTCRNIIMVRRNKKTKVWCSTSYNISQDVMLINSARNMIANYIEPSSYTELLRTILNLPIEFSNIKFDTNENEK